MQLTNFQRSRKLARDLITRPGNLPRYVAQNLIRPRPSLDLELPWFSYGAIDFLDGFLNESMTVFEFGSGGSTLFFARRCRQIRSVEDDPIWAARVRTRVAELGLSNAEIIECPFDFSDATGFEDSTYLTQVRAATCDVIIVDGADNDYTVRPHCFHAAEDQVNPGGIIVVDDSWRYPSLRTNHRARRFEIFESVGPARFGVTSTDIYFY